MYTNNSHMREFLPAGRLSTRRLFRTISNIADEVFCENNNQLISYIR